MKEHSSQGRGILAAWLALISMAAVNLDGADANFIVVAKGQRWAQTNSSAAQLSDGSNHVFLASVDTSGPGTVTNGSLILPNDSLVALDGDGNNHGGIELLFESQSLMDESFPSGTYRVVIDGVNDGSVTNAIVLTGDSYPATPHFDAFPAAQVIDPATDFNLTWEPVAGATANDFIAIEVVDCTDEEVVSSPPPGKPGALDGSATNFVITARSLRPGMIYKVKMIIAHFTTFDENSYPGAIVVGGYLKELYMPITTTGTPVDCPPGRLQLVFSFPTGGFDGTNGAMTFPQGLDNYVAQLDVRNEANPPEYVEFTGPVGSGLDGVTNAYGSIGEWGAWFVSPEIPVPPFPPAGAYVVNYGGNDWTYNLLDPNASDQQVMMIPTIVLDATNSVQEVQWRFANTNGVTIDAPMFVVGVSLSLDGMFGSLYQSDWFGEPLARTMSGHVLSYPVPWADVYSVRLSFEDRARNVFVSRFQRDSGPPPVLQILTQELPIGTVGQPYTAPLSATGGQPPYLWSVANGVLPEGVALSPDTGNLLGSPSIDGVFGFVIRVTDSADAFVDQELQLVVDAGGGDGPAGPEARNIVVYKGQQFLQSGPGAAVPGTDTPFHFEAFVEEAYLGAITNVVLRSPKGTNYPLDVDRFPSAPAASGGGSEMDGQTFRITANFATKSAMDAVFSNGDYLFLITSGSGSNLTATLNLSGDRYPATPHVANWLAAQSIDAFSDFTLEWDSLSGATTNDFVLVQVEDEIGAVFETPGPQEPGALDGKSTSVVIPANTLEPGVEYKCSVLLGRFVTRNTNAFPGALNLAAYAKATFMALNTLTPPPPEGQLQFSAAAFSANESNTLAQFTVTRTGGSSGAVSVDFSTEDGTAVADLDYVLTEGTLDFADGETNVTFTFELIDDSVVETSETIHLILSNPMGGAALGSQSNAVMTVIDDDVPGTAGLLQFSVSGYSVGEASATVRLVVTRTDGKAGEVTVDYFTMDGSAVGEEDFTSDFGTLIFPDGVTSQAIVLEINNDTVDETNETFQVVLDAPGGGASLGTQNLVPVTIVDNDSGGEIKFAAASAKVGEADGELVMTLSRAGGTAGSVSVDVLVTGGTGTLEDDYSPVADTVEFAAGETTATYTLLINDDSDPEGDETVLLQLTNPTGGATLGRGTNATVEIVDDEVTFQLGAETFSASEGAPAVVITIARSGPATGSVSVDLATVDGTAEAGADFVGANATVTFGPGVTSRSVAIRILGDDLVEEEETFGVVLENPNGGQLGNVAEASVTVVDNDVGGELNFKVANFTVTEKSTVAVVVVSRTGGTAGGVTFDFATEDESAIDGDDYMAVVETFEFPAGAKEMKIEVPVLDDDLDEGVETVHLGIGNPSGGALIGERASATLSIIDDDTGGTIAFSSPKYSISETGVTATITLTRSGGKAGGVTVDVITSGGSATPDVDYTAITNTLTFGANETKLTFTVDIADDEEPEGDETVLLELANPAGGASLGPRSSALLTILDDELSVQFSEATYEVVEGVRNVAVLVTRGGPRGAFAVQYATEDGEAIAGSDYAARSGTLSFSASTKSKKLLIPILNDSVSENDETFTIGLSGPTGGAILGANASAVITIHDNDLAPRVARGARGMRR